jgi:hypothetical protein
MISPPVFTDPVHLDVTPAFLQHRTLIGKWTICRLFGQVTTACFLLLIELRTRKPRSMSASACCHPLRSVRIEVVVMDYAIFQACKR